MKKVLFASSFSALLVICLLFSSCSKEQVTLNKLAGDWQYTTIKLLGISIDPATLGYTSANLHFDLCKANVQRCGGVQTLNGTANNFQYELSEDAKTVSVYNATGGTDTYTIISVDKSNLVYTMVISGVTYEFTLKKI